MNQSKLTRVSSWLFTPATCSDRFDKAAGRKALAFGSQRINLPAASVL
jgi:hypothetical protein